MASTAGAGAGATAGGDSLPSELPVTARTKIKRLPKRSIGEDGAPRSIPTGHARWGDTLMLHGKSSSVLMRQIAAGKPVCISIAMMDGFVCARAAFHHSVNYRAVVIYGTGSVVTDPAELQEAYKIFTNVMIPDRYDHIRAPTAAEIKATTVVRIPLTEMSCKVRAADVGDDPPDIANPAYWAGLIPIVTGFTTPTPAKDLLPGVPTPAHITNFTRFPRVTLGEPQQQKPAAKSPSMLVHIAVPWLLFFALLAFVLTRGFDSAEL